MGPRQALLLLLLLLSPPPPSTTAPSQPSTSLHHRTLSALHLPPPPHPLSPPPPSTTAPSQPSPFFPPQFAVFEAVYTRMHELGLDRSKVPGSGGLAWATLFAGVCGASARAIIESPIEYAKVKRQTGQAWHVAEVYQGFFLQWPRTGGMMTFIFCAVDSVRRWSGGQALATPAGQFLTWGGCSMLGFWVIWPLETLKNQVQAGTEVPGVGAHATLRQRVAAAGGLRGLYRGILPGSISVFLRNGTAAIVMGAANQYIAACGWR